MDDLPDTKELSAFRDPDLKAIGGRWLTPGSASRRTGWDLFWLSE